jgi:cob(I)alamin adenosyltransferase
MEIFNKRGDEGETSLLFGRRIAKDSLRCEAYGTLDEAISCLGIARNVVLQDKTRQIIFKVQEELFKLNGELATLPEDYDKFTAHYTAINEEMAGRLESLIIELEPETDLPKAFIIPGANTCSAYLDLARTIIRRAERRVVTLKNNGDIGNSAILHYLNRLADLLFMLARYEETRRG